MDGQRATYVLVTGKELFTRIEEVMAIPQTEVVALVHQERPMLSVFPATQVPPTLKYRIKQA